MLVRGWKQSIMQQNQAISVDQAIERLCLRHFAIYTAMQMVILLTIWNFIAGVILLVLRQSGTVSVNFTALSLAGLPVTLLIAAIVARRRAIPHEKALAIIDSYNGAGGLLLAENETGDTSWTDRQPQDCRIPTLKADFAGRLPSLVFSLFFLLLCLYTPVYSRFISVDPRLELKEIEKTAARQIEALAEEGMLSAEESTELRQTLDQISDDSNRNDPAGTFEALDQLKEKLKNVAAVNAGKMFSELERLQKLDASSIPENQARSLGQDLEKAGESSAQSAEETRQAEKNLEEYIRQQAENIRKTAEKLVKVKLIDQKTFEKLKKEGRIRPATEKDLQQNPDVELIMTPADAGQDSRDGISSGDDSNGKTGGTESSGQLKMGNSPGNGGVDRDGSTAPLNYNRRSSEHNVGFRDEKLPAPKENNLENSVAIGMSMSAPTAGPEIDAGSPAPLPVWQKPDKSTDESVIILPRHRSAVKKYFEHNNP